MEEIIKDFLENIFFKTKLTFLDFLIIGIGIFLIFYQSAKKLTTFSKFFYRKAKKDPLYLKRVEVKLDYISNLIELLPILGILGTVLGFKKCPCCNIKILIIRVLNILQQKLLRHFPQLFLDYCSQ